MSESKNISRLSFRSRCPLSTSLDILGDKWSLLVMRDIIMLDKHTFKEFISSPEKIATNILSNRLKRLEQMGLITRTQNQSNKRVFLYNATERGFALKDILMAHITWADMHLIDENPSMLRLQDIKQAM
jgi:DNA-binding HxlR family transcriptional regulator